MNVNLDKNRENKHSIEEQARPLDRSVESLFRGWFNNRMYVVLMSFQHIKARDPQTILGIQIFLRDIEHHFIPSHRPKSLVHAFRYLRRYFTVYPHVSVEQSQRAIEMVGRIYEAMGMMLKQQSAYHPKLSADEKIRREIKVSVQEVFSPLAGCTAQ